MTDGLLVAIGETDCEALGGGLLAQPINAITSFSYVAAGLTLMVGGAGVRRSQGSDALLFGSTLIAVGLGAVAFHGPQPAGSQFLHDVSIAAALLFICLTNAARLGWLGPVAKVYGLALIPIAGLLVVAPTLAAVVTGVLVAAVVVGEVLAYRSGAYGRLGRLDSAAAVLMVIAIVAYLLGRTNSAVCRPDSVWQLHGAWHVFSAAALMVWGFAAFEPGRNR